MLEKIDLNCLACIGRLPFIRFTTMKVLLPLLSLVSIVPVLSYSSGSVRSDCNENCLECSDPKSYFPKCRRCKEGYTLVKTYIRRRCESQCPPGSGQVSVWDPVVRAYICDRKTDCYWHDSNCVECLGSGSCLKCKQNYALKQKSFKNTGPIIGLNKCVNDCETCVEPRSKTLVCKTAAASCLNSQAPSAPQKKSRQNLPSPKVPTGAVGTNPSSMDTLPEPTSDGAMTDGNEDTKPTVDETDDDD